MSQDDLQRMEQINSLVKEIMAKVAEANRLFEFPDPASFEAN